MTDIIDLDTEETFNNKLRQMLDSIRVDSIPSKQKRLDDFTKDKKKTYSQDWKSYNEASQSEKTNFLKMLNELVYNLKKPRNKFNGRPPKDVRDMIMSCVIKTYVGWSSRRIMSEIDIISHYLGIKKIKSHRNTILNYFNKPEFTEYLTALVTISGLPLLEVESSFAIDSSGISTKTFDRWLDVRLEHHKKKAWKKLHICCGIKTNVITAFNVTDANRSDTRQFAKLVYDTAKYFKIKEVSADKAYSARSNYKVAEQIGAIPYIDFKKNDSSKSGGSKMWRRMYLLHKTNPNKFYERYHLRSNVECTFSMIKRKLGSSIKSKNQIAQINEILCKCLCHNLLVLNMEMHQMGINPEFEKYAQKVL